MITERLAQFVSEIKTTDIPEKAIWVAKSAITDYIGVTLAGSREDTGRIIRDYARRMGGGDESSVIGGGFKTSPELAALANGTTGHAIDFDDGGGFGHSSVVLAPAVLAVGESIGASGLDILSAYIVGFQTAFPIHSVVGSTHYARGWHGTATTGSLAATASVAWLLKLNCHQVRMALGIAASLAGGLRQNFGTMTKPLHAGNAASNGVKAAVLAQAGFTADENIIESTFGFARVFGYESQADWKSAGKGLENIFSILYGDRGAMYFKLYPSCAETHTSIDAALSLRADNELDLDSISVIELGVGPVEKTVLIHNCPETGLEGKFSLEYTVARALLSGEVRVQHFVDSSVNEPAVRGLMAKMRWVEKYPQPKAGSRKTFGPNSITVILKDGKKYYSEALCPRGSRENPLTAAELLSKFRDCASLVLSKVDIYKAESFLANLEKVENIGELMDIVAGVVV